METIQSREISVQAAGNWNGYLAKPPAPAPGIIVYHAWWGLTPFFKQFCDRLAAEGFAVLAPDLHHGKTAQTIEEAEKLMGESDFERTKAVAVSAVQWLQEQPDVLDPRNLALVGFSMGASWAMVISSVLAETIAKVVIFYGLEGIDFSTVRAEFQGHFSETDTWTKVEWSHEMEADMRAANLSVEFYRYPEAGHWFMEEDRPDAYRKEDAELAWRRMVAFLKGHPAGDIS